MDMASKVGPILFLSLLMAAATVPQPSSDWPVLIKLGMDEAIVKRKLPDIDSYLKGEKLDVLLGCDAKGKVALEANALPKQVGKWVVVPIDAKIIRARSAKQPYSYLRLCPYLEENEPHMSVIADMAVPPNSDLMVIDRGILRLKFGWKEGAWVIVESEELFARKEARCPTSA